MREIFPTNPGRACRGFFMPRSGALPPTGVARVAKQMFYPKPYPDGRDADRRVEVAWRRDDSVQIATTALQPGAPRDQDYYPGYDGPAIAGIRAASTAMTTAAENLATTAGRYVPSWQGQFVDLDRTQINELIRCLRTARDVAYGRNE